MEKKKGDNTNNNSLQRFLKKRAPIYLGLMGLFILFVIPELMGNDLQSLFPDNLTQKQKKVLDIVTKYNGPDNQGFTILEALDMKIKEEYDDDKIYDKKSSKVLINVTAINTNNYNLLVVFKTDQKQLEYSWDLNIETKEIQGKNTRAQKIIELVNFYD